MNDKNDIQNRTWVQYLYIGAAVATIVSLIVVLLTITHNTGNSPSTQAGNGGQTQSGSPTSTSLANTPQSTATPSPTLVPAKPGTVLYQTTNFNDWTVGGPWKTLNGQLLFDGSTDGYILAPFNPPSRNYSVVIRVQVPSSGLGVAGLVARIGTDSGNIVGYKAFVGTQGGFCAHVTTFDESDINMTCETSIPPGSGWHILEFKVIDSNLTFLVDGQIAAAASDTLYLDPGQVGIFATTQIIVQRFTVTQR